MVRLSWLGMFGLLFLGGLAGLDKPEAATSWPRFRGPNGTGIALDRDIPVQWKEQNSIRWKSAVPGLGNSSPVVWENLVFLQTAPTDGKDRQLLCLGAVDGQVLWSRSFPGTLGRTHQKNTLASSTPATDGRRVVALFWDGSGLSLAACDLKGTVLWQRDLGLFTSQHGAGTSPILYQDRVFLANDQDGSSLFLALDAATGKTVWEVPRPAFRACYSTPFLLERPGALPELIVASTAGITGYDPGTGTRNWNWTWHFTGSPLRTVASPIFTQGMIVANSGDGSGERHTVAIRLGVKGETEPSLAWQSKKTFPYVPSIVAWGDYLYFVNDLGLAVCLLARTGEIIWSERLGSNVSASPVLIDGKIYAVAEDGVVSVFEAAPRFKLLAKNPLGEPVMATPAVAGDRLFIRGKDHLFCIARPGGKETRQ